MSACDCGRKWLGLAEVVYHEHFGSYFSFDLHLRQRGEEVTHLAPGSLRRRKTEAPLLAVTPRLSGDVWVGAGNPYRGNR